MNIWQERFNPSQITPFEPTLAEFNKAWEWMFERDENQEFIRAGLCLVIIREHSLRLHKRGVSNSAQVAAIGIYRRYAEKKLPIRSAGN